MSSLTYTVNNSDNSSCNSSCNSSYTYNVSTYLSNNTTNYSYFNYINQTNPTMITTQGSTYYNSTGNSRYSIYGR